MESARFCGSVVRVRNIAKSHFLYLFNYNYVVNYVVSYNQENEQNIVTMSNI